MEGGVGNVLFSRFLCFPFDSSEGVDGVLGIFGLPCGGGCN